METQEERLDLVIALLNDYDINVFKLIQTYEDSEFLLRIVGLDPTWDEAHDNKLAKLLPGTAHHRDARSLKEYAESLVRNWLVEDLIYYMLKGYKLNVKKEGSDSKRQLLEGKAVSGAPDLKVEDKKNLWIEVIASYTPYWEKQGVYDLRDKKLIGLKNKSKDDPTVVLGVSLHNKQFFMQSIDSSLETLDETEWEKFGNKYTTKVVFPGGTPNLKPLSQLPNKVLNIVQEKIYKPLDPNNKLESFMTQYFEVHRGGCLVSAPKKETTHVKMRVTTNDLQQYSVYYQEAGEEYGNGVVVIPLDHVANDYDYGFQFNFKEKDRILFWEGNVLKHHIIMNLQKHKVWERFYDDKRENLILPTKYVPNLKVLPISEKFQKIM